MQLGHDPNFKFTVGRAIYKGILQFMNSQHGKDYIVQPLPVSNFAIHFGKYTEFTCTRFQYNVLTRFNHIQVFSLIGAKISCANHYHSSFVLWFRHKDTYFF